MSRIERAAATAWTRVGKLWLGLESFFVAYPTGMDDTAPGSILLSALRDGLAAGPGFCWVAGEASAIRQARTYLVADGRLDRDSVVTRGYWRLGAVNHPDYDDGTGVI